MRPGSLLAATFEQQPYVFDGKGCIERFAEVPEGQQRDVQAGQCLHLHAGPFRDLREGVNDHGLVSFIEPVVNRYAAQADGVAEREQLGRQLGALDAGDLRHGQGITLRNGAGADRFKSGFAEFQAPPGESPTAGLGLGGHIGHGESLGHEGRVEMGTGSLSLIRDRAHNDPRPGLSGRAPGPALARALTTRYAPACFPARKLRAMTTPRIAQLLTLLLALGTGVTGVLAGVFGDGDPSNGVEDDRRTLSEGASMAGLSDWYRSGGTVFCDGAVRGSAAVVDLGGLPPRREGVVIVTAAHVLMDLATGQPWAHCEYRHQGLGELPGYQVRLQERFILKGDFDTVGSAGDPDNVNGDWAFVWLGRDWVQPGGAQGLALADVRSAADGKGLLGLLAWDPERAQLTLAAGCRAVLSRVDDLSGDARGGQLLDDCDSGTGSSGGALILSHDGKARLVGIRGGQHWDEGRWPPERFPAGPPTGLPWDPVSHTNYARAVDAELLNALRQWWVGLAADDDAMRAP